MEAVKKKRILKSRKEKLMVGVGRQKADGERAMLKYKSNGTLSRVTVFLLAYISGRYLIMRVVHPVVRDVL